MAVGGHASKSQANFTCEITITTCFHLCRVADHFLHIKLFCVSHHITVFIVLRALALDHCFIFRCWRMFGGKLLFYVYIVIKVSHAQNFIETSIAQWGTLIAESQAQIFHSLRCVSVLRSLQSIQVCLKYLILKSKLRKIIFKPWNTNRNASANFRRKQRKRFGEIYNFTSFQFSAIIFWLKSIWNAK